MQNNKFSSSFFCFIIYYLSFNDIILIFASFIVLPLKSQMKEYLDKQQMHQILIIKIKEYAAQKHTYKHEK